MNPKKKEKSQKSKIEINRRQASGKKKPDLFAKFRNTEHPLDSIIPDITIGRDALPYPSADKNSGVDATLPYPSKEQAQKEDSLQSISPTRNFTKVSNSITKQAIPDGLFRGQSKHTYDVLYQCTRGAINPIRAIQITKSELVKLTGLEIKTIQRHLSFLRRVGLISVDPKIGDHKGAIYTVHIPEEITLPDPTLVQYGAVYPTLVKTTAKRVPHPGVECTTLHQGNHIANKEVNISSNTSLKTFKTDDDEFDAMIEVCRAIGKGKKSSWRELAELLKTEFESSSSRTNSVSDAPAFLAEHLRRRLAAKLPRTKTVKPYKSGEDKPLVEAESSAPEPLSEAGREIVLDALKKMPREAANGYEDHYTTEDWAWLIEKLD